MDATCAIQNSIHVFSLVHINMCPGFWVHIKVVDQNMAAFFFRVCGIFDQLFRTHRTQLKFLIKSHKSRSFFVKCRELYRKFDEWSSVNSESSPVFPYALFYDIIPTLSNRYPTTGGGEPHGYYNLVSCLLYGKHNCLLCLQMARWRQIGQL